MNWLLNWVWKLGFSWFSLWDTMGVEAHSFALDDSKYKYIISKFSAIYLS